jgi:hypothetical protein
MSTTSRRVCAALRKSRPSRTTSNRAKVYVAVPPADGWPPFDGNYARQGARIRSK